jgi:hypothetical protein
MKIFFFFSLILFCIACKRAHTRADVQNELSNAMLTFLWSDNHKDTSKTKFQILDVNYYEDSTFYECEYKVHMHIIPTGFDTTGMMTARVSKDFKRVRRKL